MPTKCAVLSLVPFTGMVLMILGCIMVNAQDSDCEYPGQMARCVRISTPDITPGAALPSPDSRSSSSLVQVMVILHTPPVVNPLSSTPLEDSYRLLHERLDVLQNAQDSLIQLLTGPQFNAHILGRTETVISSLVIQVARSRIADLRRLPAVQSVIPVQIVDPDLPSSAPQTGTEMPE